MKLALRSDQDRPGISGETIRGSPVLKVERNTAASLRSLHRSRYHSRYHRVFSRNTRGRTPLGQLEGEAAEAAWGWVREALEAVDEG